MEEQRSANMSTEKNSQSAMTPQSNMSPSRPMTAMPMRTTFPEVFYKIQPYIMMVCDEMDVAGSEMPTQEMMNRISDNIFDDVCRMYPDIADYARSCDNSDPPMERMEPGREPEMFRRRFRRRGLFRDFTDFLLLQELLRRRRRFPFGFMGF